MKDEDEMTHGEACEADADRREEMRLQVEQIGALTAERDRLAKRLQGHRTTLDRVCNEAATTISKISSYLQEARQTIETQGQSIVAAAHQTSEVAAERDLWQQTATDYSNRMEAVERALGLGDAADHDEVIAAIESLKAERDRFAAAALAAHEKLDKIERAVDAFAKTMERT